MMEEVFRSQPMQYTYPSPWNHTAEERFRLNRWSQDCLNRIADDPKTEFFLLTAMAKANAFIADELLGEVTNIFYGTPEYKFDWEKKEALLSLNYAVELTDAPELDHHFNHSNTELVILGNSPFLRRGLTFRKCWGRVIMELRQPLPETDIETLKSIGKITTEYSPGYSYQTTLC